MNTADALFDTWLANTPQGRYVAATQQAFLADNARQATGRIAWAATPALAQTLHQTNWLILGEQAPANIRSRLPVIPLLDNAVQTLFLPHGLDLCPHPDILLQECFRVLEAHGRLIITGFNPASLWRFSRTWQHAGLPHAPISLSQCKKLLAEHGLQVSEGRFMAYALPWFDPPQPTKLRHIEAAGNRWWPQHAALYGLCAIKYLCPLQAVHETADNPAHNCQLVFTATGRKQSAR